MLSRGTSFVFLDLLEELEPTFFQDRTDKVAMRIHDYDCLCSQLVEYLAQEFEGRIGQDDGWRLKSKPVC